MAKTEGQNKAGGGEFPLLRRKTHAVNSDDADSLKLYYRQLEESAPMEAEEEIRLWNKIDVEQLGIRKILYRFGFVIQEHVKLLKNTSPELLPDLFPASSLPDDLKNNPKALVLKINPWLADLGRHDDALRKAYNAHDLKTFDALHAKTFDLLMRYPVHREKLTEWMHVAQLYFDEAALGNISEKTGGLLHPKRYQTVEPRILLPFDTFADGMRILRVHIEKLEECRKEILTANLRLVVSIVNHYHCRNVQIGDLIQEGNLGLIRAMEKFDYKLGHRFSTYATWWIKQSVTREIASQSRVIRLPSHMLFTISRIRRAEQNFIQENGRDPSVDELAVILELPKERINAIKKMACQPISLQAPLEKDEQYSLENFLCDEGETADPVRQLAFKLMQKYLVEALDSLTERERQIIRLRFGLDGQPAKTLIEVSKLFNLTRERIRQLECRAIRKLRAPDFVSYFQDYFK